MLTDPAMCGVALVVSVPAHAVQLLLPEVGDVCMIDDAAAGCDVGCDDDTDIVEISGTTDDG